MSKYIQKLVYPRHSKIGPLWGQLFFLRFGVPKCNLVSQDTPDVYWNTDILLAVLCPPSWRMSSHGYTAICVSHTLFHITLSELSPFSRLLCSSSASRSLSSMIPHYPCTAIQLNNDRYNAGVYFYCTGSKCEICTPHIQLPRWWFCTPPDRPTGLEGSCWPLRTHPCTFCCAHLKEPKRGNWGHMEVNSYYSWFPHRYASECPNFFWREPVIKL